MVRKTHQVVIGWNDVEKKWKANPGALGDEPGRPGYPDENKKIRKDHLINFAISSTDTTGNPVPEEDKRYVTLFFPDESIFGLSHVKLPEGEDITLEVRRIGKDIANTNKIEKNLYAAYSHKDYCFAEGESSPIIIIEK